MLEGVRRLFGRTGAAAEAVFVKAAERVAEKVVRLPWWPPWIKESFRPYTFRRLVADGYAKNSAVYACVRQHAGALPEPELHIWRQQDGELVKLPEHAMRRLLANPNPEMSEPDMWEEFWTYAAIGGVSYLWIERNILGQPLHLWPLHRGQMRPLPDPAGFKLGYMYTYWEGDTQAGVFVPTKDVLQYKWAVDPRNRLEGFSPLEACANPVDTDNKILAYIYALLNNDATPRTVLAINRPLLDDEGKDLKSRMTSQYGGENIGSVMVLEAAEGATVSRVGANLNELAAEVLHNVPETRIAACFEAQAVLAGLNVGLQRAIRANARELREHYTQSVCVPRWRKAAAMMGRLLGAEYTDEPGLVCAFDLGTVQALAAKEAERREMVRADVQAGILMVNEARAEMGRKTKPGRDVFLLSAGLIEVPEGSTLAEARAAEAAAGSGGVDAGAIDEVSAAVSEAFADPTLFQKAVLLPSGKRALGAAAATRRRIRERQAVEDGMVGAIEAALAAQQDAIIAELGGDGEADTGAQGS